MTSADPFPDATYEAKLCEWVDNDGDRIIDSGEEPSVSVFTGPLAWAPGATSAEVSNALGTTDGQLCARMWIYASYPDGHRSTKRTSIACVAQAPPPAVPDVGHVALLGSSALATLAGAWWWSSRRASSRPRRAVVPVSHR